MDTNIHVSGMYCFGFISRVQWCDSARSMFAGKTGQFELCIADAERLVTLGHQGVGYLRLGRAYASMGDALGAAAAFSRCAAFAAQLSDKQAAQLAKWGAGVSKAGPSDTPSTGPLSTNGRYPSTPHLPFSPQVNDDDISLDARACSVFVGAPVVITEKLDGGNCCLCDGMVFARTHSHEATHASFGPGTCACCQRSMVFRTTRNYAVKAICNEIFNSGVTRVPPGTMLFGENMFGVHSIEYDNLRSFFYLFGVQKPDGTSRARRNIAFTYMFVVNRRVCIVGGSGSSCSGP